MKSDIRTEKAPRFRRGAKVVAGFVLVIAGIWVGATYYWGDPDLGAALGAIAAFAVIEATRRLST